MSSELPKVIFGPTNYVPTSNRSGVSGKSLLRLQNLILAGSGEDAYLLSYAGSEDQDQTIPTENLTGTLTAAIDSTTIAGAGTQFTTELRAGQEFWAEDDLFVVTEVVNDTEIKVARGPTITALAASTGTRTPIAFEIDNQVGTLIQGDALRLDKGSILATGTGTLRINGAVLQGASMVLSGGPKIAIFDPNTGDYAIYDLGFDTPTVAPTLTAVAGGTHGMQAGDYSIRLVPSSTVTAGYSNPGPRANVSLTVADQRIQVDVGAVVMDTAAGQDGWDAYGTQLGVVNVNQGPWDFIRTVPATEIVANIFYLDYLNAEISNNGSLDFDADPPPSSVGFVALLQGNPQWISCTGKWGGSPGPSLFPAKPQDIEAAPAIWNVTSSPPENILGFVASQARLYLLCGQTLQQAVYAPTGDPLIPPTQIRPFWRVGFSNCDQLTFVEDLLVGYPHGGPTRSTSDSETVRTQFLGADIAEIIADWDGAYVKVAWDTDPLVNAACFFYPCWSQNAGGFWTTLVLLWGFNQERWIGSVLLSDLERDMCVVGVTNASNQLYFLAGGRFNGGTQFDTFKWNTAAGTEIDYYAAWELTAAGTLNQNKTVKAARMNGKVTNGRLDIYGFDSATPEDLTNLETGTNPQVSINLGTLTDIETTPRERINVPNLFTLTARISGTYNGTDEIVDRISGATLEYLISGVRR